MRACVCACVCVRALLLSRRLPLEPESASLGAALQAAAVGEGVPVAQFVQQHLPPISEEVVAPNPANKPAYDAAMRVYKEAGAALFAPAG